MILLTLFTILGGLFRRYFGGWLEWPNPVTAKAIFKKFILGPALSFGAGYALSGSLIVAAIWCVVLGCVWWVIFKHARAMTMGFDPKHPEWTHIKSILWFILWYGGAMAICGLAWYFIAGNVSGLLYAVCGLLVWIPHYLAQTWGNTIPENPDPNVFIDSRIAAGEVGLGAWVYGSAALANLIL